MQGEEMKVLRKRAGMTQEQLAESIGMTSTSIGQMERGAAAIEKRTELAVLQVLRQQRESDALANELERIAAMLATAKAHYGMLGRHSGEIDVALSIVNHEAAELRNARL